MKRCVGPAPREMVPPRPWQNLADGGEVLLGAVEVPERGQDAAVLVRVGITDHHLLRQPVGEARVAAGRERPLGHRVRQEGVEDAGAALQVVDGLEQRDHGQEAMGVVRTTRGEAGLAGEQVNREEVRDRAGHRDDQRPQARGAMLADVHDQRAVAREHRIGLGADAGLLAHERTRRAELGVEEAEPAGLIPLGIVMVILAGGREELADGLVVEGAVLADIQAGHVEAEDAQEADERIEFGAGDATGPHLDQGLAQEQQVGDDAFRRGMLTGRELALDGGQAKASSPGFAVVAGQRGGAGLTVRGGVLLDLLDEDGGRQLQVVAQRQALAEDLQTLMADADRGGAEEPQGARGDLRRDQGVPVAVAADPRAQGHEGQGIRVLDAGNVETRLLPGLPEAQVHAHDRVGEDLRQEVVDVAQLRLDFGLLLVEFAGAPQALEGDLDLVADGALLGRGPHVVLAPDQELVDLAVDLEDRRALGLGRVGGEDGLDADAGEALRDLLVGDVRRTQGLEGATPGARIGGEAELVLAQALGLGRGVLLDHVQQLEGDRIGLHPAVGEDLHAAELALAHPRQGAGEILVLELLEHLDEAPHHEVEVLVDFLQAAGEVGADGHATAVLAWTAETPQPQTPAACVRGGPSFAGNSPWRTNGSSSPTCGNRKRSAPSAKARTWWSRPPPARARPTSSNC